MAQPPKLPGRLGQPDLDLETEPRVHAKLLAEAKRLGIGKPTYPSPEILVSSSDSVIRAYVHHKDEFITSELNQLDYSVACKGPSVELVSWEEEIPALDGNKIRLKLYRPASSTDGDLPAIVHFHSGGMAILGIDNVMHSSLVEAVSKTGLLVIEVDFRNAITATGANPFPAGLNDCVAATRWVHDHKTKLKASKLILMGESGGANLAMATAIRAKREGWVQDIAGVYGSTPYIAGAFDMPLDWKLRELPSLVECDGYITNHLTSAIYVHVYDPTGASRRDPLAWPFWAAEEDLVGLPPHFIVTDELDPTRDEGNAYVRKLASAGVDATGRVNLGIFHEGVLAFRSLVPHLFLAMLAELKTFADQV